MPDVRTDLRIHYRDLGEGPPVLWHTGGCGDGRMWELAGYVDALPGHRHLLMDHRGHGRSESPADLAGHQLSRYVADVLAVLDDAGTERTAFVGYSFGARVGYAVARSAPERFTSLVALDMVPDPAIGPDELRADAREVLARGTREIIEEMAAEEAEPPPPWLVDHLCTTDTRQFAGCIEAEATEDDPWAAAPSLDVPVLLLLGVGPEDQEYWELGKRYAATMPRGEAVAVHGARHLAAFWRTDLTLPHLSRFLAEH